MSKSFFVILIFTLTIASFGCKSSSNDSSQQGNEVSSDPKPGAGVEGHQYRAVCLEKESHGGNVQVLSRWLDDREKAYELGNYHSDFKDKGHRWVIEERVESGTAQR